MLGPNAERQRPGRGLAQLGQAIAAASIVTERAPALAVPSKWMKFIAGEPMKSATNMVAGGHRSPAACRTAR
jgi:hypothetical protein